jgi:transcriptional regulator
MYQPPAFVETRTEALHALIRARPLGLLITAGAHGVVADPVPFLLAPEIGPHGTLQAHLARANPHFAALAAAAEVLVVFQDAGAYVSPGWYESKREHGRVVPTWNYVMVQVRGTPKIIDDAPWLRSQVERLTDRHEQGRADPWAVDDAPAAFIAGQIRGIVGLEIAITAIAGKFKLSQNRSAADQAGVLAGLDAQQDMRCPALAALMRRHGTAPDAVPHLGIAPGIGDVLTPL